ncbi:MAG: FAD-dependent oxidoreductase [Candidatus Micrarchaeota archaeon]
MGYDVLVVGAGAAGLSAAIYSARKGLKTVIASVDTGGQLNLTSHIENYPAADPMSGPELASKMSEQAGRFGAEMVHGKVVKVAKSGEGFEAALSNGETIQSRAVVLAFGQVARMMGVPGEEKFLGRGVSTCVTCDGPLFRDKEVAVVGGGTPAVEGVVELAAHSKKVYSVSERKEYSADKALVEKMAALPNVEVVSPARPVEISGEKAVQALAVEKDGSRREIAVQGVFVELGHVVDTSAVKGLVELNDANEVIVDANANTSVPGVFAAGDCTTVKFKQAVISAGEGAKAGLEAYRYLSGGKGIAIDWK